MASMASSNSISYYSLLLLATHLAYGYLVKTPPEVVMSGVGNQVVLPCATNISNASVTWYHKGSVQNKSYIAVYNSRRVLNRIKYDMKSTTAKHGTHYDLVLKKASFDEAGSYACRDNNGMSIETAVVQVIVVNQSQPNCRYFSRGYADVAVNDPVRFECSWTFAGNIHPWAVWTDEEGKTINSTAKVHTLAGDPRTRLFQTYVERTARTENIGLLSAIITFDRRHEMQSTLRYGSEHSKKWTSPEIKVAFPVRNIFLNNTPSSIYMNGQVLCCTSEGNPDPVYTWLNLRTKEYSFGPCLVLNAEEMFIEYRCIAANTYRNVTYFATATLQGIVSGPRRSVVSQYFPVITLLIVLATVTVVVGVIIAAWHRKRHTNIGQRKVKFQEVIADGSEAAFSSRSTNDKPKTEMHVSESIALDDYDVIDEQNSVLMHENLRDSGDLQYEQLDRRDSTPPSRRTVDANVTH